MKFDINNYKGKYVMHCKTLEEAKEFCNYINSLGVTDYNALISFNMYSGGICYNFNQGTHATKNHYKNNDFTILEWSDFTTEFTKADLKDGMIVECANGKRYLALGDKLINGSGFLEIKDYNSDLKSDINPHKWNINKVYKVDACHINGIFNNNNLTLIWERKEEPVEMTLEEVCKALGKEIKIIKG